MTDLQAGLSSGNVVQIGMAAVGAAKTAGHCDSRRLSRVWECNEI
jgi:hypothetical protein